jgi:LuxR family maltose regulon positive regulatory protein
VTAARAAGVELVEVSATGHLALIEFMRGSLGEAYDEAQAARDLARRRGWTHTRHAAPAHLVLAMIELERHHLDGVEQALKHGFDANLCDPEAAQRTALRIAHARLLLAKGSRAAAAAVLETIRREARMPVLPPVLARWLALAEAEIDLVAGRPQRVLERIALPSQGDPPAHREQVCRSRAELALGNIDKAEALLASVREAATDVVAVVEAWLVTAMLADIQGRRGHSIEAMSRALFFAEPQGIRRPFLVLDRLVVAMLIERHRTFMQDGSQFAAGLLAELEPGRFQTGARRMGTPLSSRELEVLRYLPTVLNAAEIADELHVSVNTVKAHLRSIYSKLDASRRREAVIRAREAGFIW